MSTTLVDALPPADNKNMFKNFIANKLTNAEAYTGAVAFLVWSYVFTFAT